MAVLEGSGGESAAEVFSRTRNHQADRERYSLREREKKVLRNVQRYKDLLSGQYKVKKCNFMQDEQFLCLAIVHYSMSTKSIRDSVFNQYAAEIKGWSSEKQKRDIWKIYGGYYLLACVMMFVVIVGAVLLGFSENPFKVLTPKEIVIYVILWLLYGGVQQFSARCYAKELTSLKCMKKIDISADEKLT